MEKTMELLLTFALCLSLYAYCGKAGAPETTIPITTQTTTETFTADATIALQEETTPRERVIEISLDNWQDYYEFKEYVDCDIRVDVFDDPTGCYNSFCSLLVPKADIADKIIFADVKMKYDVDYDISQISWNAKDFTFELLSSRKATENDWQLYGHFKRDVTATTRDFYIEHDFLLDGKRIEDTLTVPNALVICNGEYGSFERMTIFSDDEWSETGTGEVHNPVNVNITRIEGTLTIAG